MKKIFAIDWALVPAFLLSSASGVGLHAAGHCPHHDVWHLWAVVHIAASALFLTFAALHVKTHWGWYRGLAKKGIGSKSRITLFLTALMVFVVATGLILLSVVEGGCSGIGLWHYAAGLLLIAVALIHVLSRLGILLSALKKK